MNELNIYSLISIKNQFFLAIEATSLLTIIDGTDPFRRVQEPDMAAWFGINTTPSYIMCINIPRSTLMNKVNPTKILRSICNLLYYVAIGTKTSFPLSS